MKYNNESHVPAMFHRIYSVWYRHVKVYTSSFLSNAFPPFFEPIIFLLGLGFGLGQFIETMGNMSYVLFLSTGLIVTSSMFTASYECTYGTFIRLEFDRIYDGMLGAPISSSNLVIGELLFAGTKGIFFSFAVLIIMWVSGIITYPLSILAVFVGFLSALMFASLAMFITSKIGNINHFNFYFTGLISPMFFFSGVVFPIDKLPKVLAFIAEFVPLTHVVRMSRQLCVQGLLNSVFLLDLLYCVGFIILFGWLAIVGLRKRMID